jgi:hypothetical protein
MTSPTPFIVNPRSPSVNSFSEDTPIPFNDPIAPSILWLKGVQAALSGGAEDTRHLVTLARNPPKYETDCGGDPNLFTKTSNLSQKILNDPHEKTLEPDVRLLLQEYDISRRPTTPSGKSPFTPLCFLSSPSIGYTSPTHNERKSNK